MQLDNALLLQVLIGLPIIHVPFFVLQFLSRLSREHLLSAFLFELFRHCISKISHLS